MDDCNITRIHSNHQCRNAENNISIRPSSHLNFPGLAKIEFRNMKLGPVSEFNLS